MSGVFSKVGGLKPRRSNFNLSFSNLLDLTFGQIVPFACIECVPGDSFRFSPSVIGRLTSALSSPMLAQMDIVLEAFFTPTRILMGRDANFDVPPSEVTFEELLVGGRDGNQEYTVPVLMGNVGSNDTVNFGYGGIGDYLGIQPNVNLVHGADYDDRPLAFPWRAYRLIWNEYYRDSELMDEIQVAQVVNGDSSSFIPCSDYDQLLYRCWRKDYFTSCLPYQQFGTSPAFNVSGVLPIEFDKDSEGNIFLGSLQVGNYGVSGNNTGLTFGDSSGHRDYRILKPLYEDSDGDPAPSNRGIDGRYDVGDSTGQHIINGFRGTSAFVTNIVGKVDLGNAVTFDVSELRTGFQIQKWMERNARGGIRYTEYLNSHFGVSPSDARLQRPEFIGAMRQPWLVSEVLQTSSGENSTPQGTQAGQAISVHKGYLGSFKAYEFGYILIMASVLPKATYQQGMPRLFSRKTRFDFYSPEFAHLSEQAVLNKEIYVSGNHEMDNGVFGFQGIWNELRYLPSRVSNHMRTGAPTYSFDYWHLGRYFAETPILNKEFLQVGATAEQRKELMRVFAVQDENPFILNIGMNITAKRPLPYVAEPGLVDHF